MKGYRTIVYAVINVLCGAAIGGGIMDEAARDMLIAHLDAIVAAALGVNGIAVAVLRAITSTAILKPK